MTTKHYIFITSTVLSLLIGFWIGRATIKPKEMIKYIKGETIYAEYPAHLLQPVKIEVPEHPTLPYYLFRERIITVDSIEYTVIELDSSRVHQDYITRKTYDLALFSNDKQGEFQGAAIVQYNDLQAFNYSFTPINKIVTVVSKPKWTPFISGSYHTISGVGVGGGLFYHNLGLQYYHYQDNSSMLAISYKF